MTNPLDEPGKPLGDSRPTKRQNCRFLAARAGRLDLIDDELLADWDLTRDEFNLWIAEQVRREDA